MIGSSSTAGRHQTTNWRHRRARRTVCVCVCVYLFNRGGERLFWVSSKSCESSSVESQVTIGSRVRPAASSLSLPRFFICRSLQAKEFEEEHLSSLSVDCVEIPFLSLAFHTRVYFESVQRRVQTKSKKKNTTTTMVIHPSGSRE